MLANNREDPTRTTTIRREYARKLRGQLRSLNARIRDGIVKNDAFGLRGNQDMPVFRFREDSDKIDEFLAWLEREEQQGVLDVISRNENTYVRTGYHRGLEHAERELQRAGVSTAASVEEIFNRPVHQDTLQSIYTRNFEELQGITSEMNRQISRELTDGFARGVSPTEMARNITDRVDKIGKHRATVMARTETIRAHKEATLNRYERMSVDRVTIRAELSTAGDDRVCPVCASLEGETFTIKQAREDTFTFDGSEHPMSPPLHPQCRCALLPVVSS